MVYFCFSVLLTLQDEISNEVIALIGYFAFFALILITVFIVFFIAFQRRKNIMLQDKIEQQKLFNEELANAEQEIQEETSKQIGKDLHDNVGQILVFARMQLRALMKRTDEELSVKLGRIEEAVDASLTEVRTISKSLNSDVIAGLMFDNIIENEVGRLNNLDNLDVYLEINGTPQEFFNKKAKVILFRIFQEFCSNTLKYANASELKIFLDYKDNKIHMKVLDNGVGFDHDTIEKGSGLINMEKRAQLIGADFRLESRQNLGTELNLSYFLGEN